MWVLNEIIERALRCKLDRPRYAYIAPLLKQAKRVSWDYAKHYTRQIPGVAVNESELRIDFMDRRISLYGADNPDALRGLYLDGVVLDEYAQMRPGVWAEIIRPTLADRGGWAIFIGTPQGRNEFWRMYDGALNGWPDDGGKRTIDPEWYAAMFRASDTGVLSIGEIDAMRRTMTEDQADQELECSFSAALQGAFYGRQLNEIERAGHIRKVEYDPNRKVHTAWDIGLKDDTAIWFFQKAPFEIHVIDHYSAYGERMPHYAKVLQDKGYLYGTHWLPHDARPETFAAENSVLKQAVALLPGGDIKIAPAHDVQDGIEAVRAILPRCWFDAERCYLGLEALRNYQREYDDELKVFRKTPRHDWASHAADAFRYLAVAYRDETGDAPKPITTIRDVTVPLLKEHFMQTQHRRI